MNRINPDDGEALQPESETDSELERNSPSPLENTAAIISPSSVGYDESSRDQDYATSGNSKMAGVAAGQYLTIKSVDLWKKYKKCRKLKRVISESLFKGAVDELGDFHKKLGQLSSESSRVKPKEASSRRKEKANFKLISYFVKINADDIPEIDMDYVYSLISSNFADINTRDIYGQTIMHEIAREWHTDIAKFFVENGGDINIGDYYGRTPLHIAAANDYAEMSQYLIDNGALVDTVTCHDVKNLANLDMKIVHQRQTPLHFAAAADARSCCQILLENGADIEARDCRNRTPLFVAAELDRSVAAEFLINSKADATAKDSSGNMVLSSMISKMPIVAYDALDQLCAYNRRDRRQYYYLNKIVPCLEEIQHESRARHPLEVIVREEKIDMITHPLIYRLVHVLWVRHGRREAQKDAIITILLLLFWTVTAVSVPYNERFIYTYPQSWWRVLFFLLAAFLTILMVVSEVKEYWKAKWRLDRYKEWRIAQVRKDLDYCHPMRPNERTYIDNELLAIKTENLFYWNGWNIYDWFVILLLFITIVLHVIPVAMYNTNPHYNVEVKALNGTSRAPNGIEIVRNETTNIVQEVLCYGSVSQVICDNLVKINWIQNCVFSVTILVLFCRLLKVIRMTKLMGPFIVILTRMFADVLRFAILVVIIFVGYCIAFWMIWDGRIWQIDGIEQFDELGFLLFRLMLVDEWPMDDMLNVSKPMTYLLVGSYLAVIAILFINLYIALLSDTFQRIYDNAISNAAMQRAYFVMEVWGGLDLKELYGLLEYLNSKECSPYTLPWDDDGVEDVQSALKKVTHQIYDKIENLDRYIREEEEEEETLELKSKKILVNRSELVELTRSIKSIQEEMRVSNTAVSERLEEIESNVQKLRKRPKHQELVHNHDPWDSP